MKPCHHTEPVEGCRVCELHSTRPDYRALWDAAPEAPPRQLTDQLVRCPHLHRRVRDADGKVKTRGCGPCGNKTLDVFQCRCPSRILGPNKPDEVTLADCQACPYKPRPTVPDARKLILKNHLSPGDVIVMSAAIHSLHRAHPGKFLTAIDSSTPAIWEHNPDVSPLDKAREEKWEEMACHYPAIQRCGQEPIHFLSGYAEYFADNLQVKVPLCVNRPLVYLSAEEKGWQNQVEQHFGYRSKWWVINAGYKTDFTCKAYPHYQAVVDQLQGRIQFVQVGKAEHIHPPLKGVIDLRGKTDDRQLIRLIHHAQGVVCGTTYLMHLAAALEKPAVILAGAREPRHWNTYPRQALLSTVGMLPCAKDAGCWKSRVLPLKDGVEQDNSLCECPVFTDPPAPKCMAMIDPETVAVAVMGYYIGGVLP